MLFRKLFNKNLTKILVFFLFPLHSMASFTEEEVRKVNELLACYHYALKQKTGPDKYDLAVQHFPQDLLYELFIDKARLASPRPEEQQVHPSRLFDVAEPGYH